MYGSPARHASRRHLVSGNHEQPEAAKSRLCADSTSFGHPGFSPGISGNHLLARLRAQARRYGTTQG
jgi:hypothetical protein